MTHAIYLDNASTSFPKPEAVLAAVMDTVKNICVNPGRGGYATARAADRLVHETRLRAADFFGTPDPARVIFTPGGTYSINMAMRGFLKEGDHVIMTGRQHNAVTRTMELFGPGVSLTRFPWSGGKAPGAEELRRLATPKTRAVVVNHASNVDGLFFPLAAIGSAARELGLVLIVDAAQSAGIVEIDVTENKVDILCVTGHKGLLGTAGTGLLILRKGMDLDPVIAGGTGSFSDDVEMPRPYPDRLEPGSLNLAGIAALNAGMREVQTAGVAGIFQRKMALTRHASETLQTIGGVRVFWPENPRDRIPLFSFTIEGMDPADVGNILDETYGIACRVGLHCAPGAHREIGTFPEGTIRFAPGYLTTEADVETFLRAVKKIAGAR